jgi:hypothetical protein
MAADLKKFVPLSSPSSGLLNITSTLITWRQLSLAIKTRELLAKVCLTSRSSPLSEALELELSASVRPSRVPACGDVKVWLSSGNVRGGRT